jgi:hypothetical protein
MAGKKVVVSAIGKRFEVEPEQMTIDDVLVHQALERQDPATGVAGDAPLRAGPDAVDLRSESSS